MANRAQRFNASVFSHMGVPALESGCDGRGIVIGFVDYGFDVLHPCLRDAASGRSRLRWLWDQNAAGSGVLDGTAIDRLIETAERQDGRTPADDTYDPHANYFGRQGVACGAHGTLMASIAAGSAVGGFRGVAPAAELIGVQLALADHQWKEEDSAGEPTWRDWDPATAPVWNGWRSYDEAPQIMSALDFLYERACRLGARGLVINLSIGACAGAHDGRSAVERKIADLARRDGRGRGPECVLVVGVGNAGADDGHHAGSVVPGHPLCFEWRMSRHDATQNKLEIWYRSDVPLEITLSLPGADPSHTRLALTEGRTHAIMMGGARVGIADHVPRARAPLSCARLLVHPPYVPRTIWPQDADELCLGIACAMAEGGGAAAVHAWIERDDGPVNHRSTLFPSHPGSTMSSLAAAADALVVAGHDHHRADSGPAVFPPSSLGPAPWGHRSDPAAPCVSAPAHRIWGARSKTRGFIETSGTSAATALTTGAVALLMQAAGARGLPRKTLPVLLSGGGGAWSPRLGYGAVHIAKALGDSA